MRGTLMPKARTNVGFSVAAHIEADPQKRRADILKQVRKLAREAGGQIADEGVLGEVTNLVEQPTALLGAFDEAHLALPREVLVLVKGKPAPAGSYAGKYGFIFE